MSICDRGDPARAGLEADQHDRDRVSSDQGVPDQQSGCDRSDQGQPSNTPFGVLWLDAKEGSQQELLCLGVLGFRDYHNLCAIAPL